MTNPNPATPANAATPGSNENGNGTPSATPTPASTPGQGNESEGKVTLFTKEFAQLQRDAARGRSKERREQRGRPANNGAADDGSDPAVAEMNQRLAEANRKALQLEVKDKVRDLLEKPEYSVLPKSTRELILKNPASLSDASNAEDALLDIEDFLDEQASVLRAEGTGQGTPSGNGAPVKNDEPKGHETPTRVNAAVPAPAANAGLEDTQGLHGPALSRAVLRNQMRKARSK